MTTLATSPTSAITAPAAGVPNRSVPPLGGLNATLLRTEFGRILRNRRTLIMALAMPIIMTLMITATSYTTMPYGKSNVAAMVLVGMALWGAMISSAGAGAAVSVERSTGWSRQLRLTPLSPIVYVGVKVAVGLLVGALSIVSVFAVGYIRGTGMTVSLALETAMIVWLGSAMFAAFGLFLGYLLPTDNAMQFIGPLMTAFAFLGGIFTPVDPHSTMGHIAQFTPLWGLHQLSIAPFGAGDFSWTAVGNVVAWLAVFVGGAAWRMSKDTARV